MARNNVKLLTKNELDYFNRRYNIYLDGENIVVKINNYKRETIHPFGVPFFINARKIRKINFNEDAINIWAEFLSNGEKYTLVDVQQAVNSLHIAFQDINFYSVENLLLKDNIKIKVRK